MPENRPVNLVSLLDNVPVMVSVCRASFNFDQCPCRKVVVNVAIPFDVYQIRGGYCFIKVFCKQAAAVSLGAVVFDTFKFDLGLINTCVVRFEQVN